MHKLFWAGFAAACITAAFLGMASCAPSSVSQAGDTQAGDAQDTQAEDTQAAENIAPDGGEEMALGYAKEFRVWKYADGTRFIRLNDGSMFFTEPAGTDAPQDLPEGTTVLSVPVQNIFMAASSPMSLFSAIGALDDVRYTYMDADRWYIDPVSEKVASGEIQYVGKYDSPDYEALTSGGCRLAVENAMIFGKPEVMEKLLSLGIPVLVDQSSYETHVLGRVEWVRLYGILAGKEAEADAVYEAQKANVEAVQDLPPTGKKVAFFYFNSKGGVTIRRDSDYIVGMIKMAGADYIYGDPEQKDGGEGTTGVEMSLEDFYSLAKDADYLIYNGVSDKTVSTLADLTAKSDIMKDFRAVRDGTCWICNPNFYQQTDQLSNFITDVRRMTDGENDGMTFIRKLE